MRISDWSSDVCSSDLKQPAASGRYVERESRRNSLRTTKSRTTSAAEPATSPQKGSTQSVTAAAVAMTGQHDGLLSNRRRVSASSPAATRRRAPSRSEEHTSELQSLMRSSNAVFCLKQKKTK